MQAARSQRRRWALTIRPMAQSGISTGSAPARLKLCMSWTHAAPSHHNLVTLNLRACARGRKLLHRGRPATQPMQSSAASPFVSIFPRGLQPYLRLARFDKPVGTWLLLWPGYWSIALAAAPGALPDLQTPVMPPTQRVPFWGGWQMLAVFGVGTVIMRSAGCTVNDLWDRDFDKNVERTRTRPITSGEISVPSGIVFLGGQLLVGLGVLLQLNQYTVLLGASSVPLVVAYPLMKRVIHLPQLFLGITFNWGALMGWAAVHGSICWPAVLPLYGSAVCWTMIYDTLYAHQDKRDDARLGLHSTALTFGDQTKPILAGFGAAMAGGLVFAGVEAGLSWPFFVGTGLTSAHLAWQLVTAKVDDVANLARRFDSNKWIGALVFASIVAGRVTAA